MHYDEGFNKLLALEIKLIETAMNNSPKYFEDDLAMIKQGAMYIKTEYKK